MDGTAAGISPPRSSSANDDEAKEKAGGGSGGEVSKEVIISVSVTISVLVVLLIGVAVVLVKLNNQKKVSLSKSRRGRGSKVSRVDRESNVERGSKSLMSSHATDHHSQAPRPKHSNSSESDPYEPPSTVNISNELSSANGIIACASPAPASARASQVYRRKILRSSSRDSVMLQTGSSLLRQQQKASMLDATSPKRRWRSAELPQ